MKYYISLLFVSSLLITSCKKDTEVKNSMKPTTVIPFTEVGNQMKAQSQTSAEQQTSANNPVPTNSTSQGVNPAHGQAGHRCDIPVGQPLSTPAVANKPQNTPVTTTKVTNTPSTNQVITTPVNAIPTAEGMNPPHGQENHKCDIAVGAPLPKN